MSDLSVNREHPPAGWYVPARPQRIQQRRVKGADIHAEGLALNGLPTVSVVRGTPWGNPFSLVDHPRPAAIELFRRLVNQSEPGTHTHPSVIRRHLRGKNLACYCRRGEACHADVLLKIANEEDDQPCRS